MRLHIDNDGTVSTASGIQALRKGGRVVKRTKTSVTVEWPRQEPMFHSPALPAMTERYNVSKRRYNPASGLETFERATSNLQSAGALRPVGDRMSRKRGKHAPPSTLTQQSINKRRT